MAAIFVIGGQQYHANVGDTLYVQKLHANQGEQITFDRVLMLDNKIGKPTVKNASVVCEVVKHGKQKKITVIKFISQKHHMKKQGHRQAYTQLVVKKING